MIIPTCHILPPSEIFRGLFWVVFTGSKVNICFVELAERVEYGNCVIIISWVIIIIILHEFRQIIFRLAVVYVCLCSAFPDLMLFTCFDALRRGHASQGTVWEVGGIRLETSSSVISISISISISIIIIITIIISSSSSRSIMALLVPVDAAPVRHVRPPGACGPIHPVPITRFSLTRCSPRVGLPRNLVWQVFWRRR